MRGGEGETQLEVDRRRVRQRITDLKREIEGVRRHRALYREQRQREAIPVIALVGYTNAGKSTLLNALTDANVTAQNRLFDTLDPTTRRIKLPSGRVALLSDTVGFIQKLPPTVVAAFRATLEELEFADVLVHMLDITHPCGFEHSETVRGVIDELGLSEKPLITALNKIDKLAEGERLKKVDGDFRTVLGEAWPPLEELIAHYPNGVAMSAGLGWGLDDLLEKIDGLLGQDMVDITISLPYSAGDLASLFHAKAAVKKRSYTKDGIVLRGRLPQSFVRLFENYIVSGKKSASNS
jgi:GTP-binding protein HflX